MVDLRLKLAYTAVVYFLFLQLALRYGISGPTLTDLKDNLGVTTGDVSNSVSVMCVGICIGAISSGLLIKFFRRELIAFVLVLATAAIVAIITFVGQFWLFLACNLLVGITSGAAISLCESWILEIWGNQCGPYMQALQFFRGLGYIIAPLLADPFLANQEESDNVAKNGTANATVASNFTESERPPYNYRIRTPYILNAVMLVAGAAFLLCMLIYQIIKDRQGTGTFSTSISQTQIMSNSVNSIGDAKSEQSVVVQDKNGESVVVASARAKYFGYGIVALCLVFYLFFYEEVIVIFLPTFATNLDLNLSKSEASLLTTAFSLSNVIGKACSVLLALKLSHFVLLYMNLSIMIGSLVVIIIFGNGSNLLLWVGVCLHGIGLSSVIASLYTLMESTVEMNTFICGLLNMMGTMGSVIMPLIVGPHLDETPMVLMYACVVCAVACLILFVVIHIALRNKNTLIATRTSDKTHTGKHVK